jgi:hypothetical protein
MRALVDGLLGGGRSCAPCATAPQAAALHRTTVTRHVTRSGTSQMRTARARRSATQYKSPLAAGCRRRAGGGRIGYAAGRSGAPTVASARDDLCGTAPMRGRERARPGWRTPYGRAPVGEPGCQHAAARRQVRSDARRRGHLALGSYHQSASAEVQKSRSSAGRANWPLGQRVGRTRPRPHGRMRAAPVSYASPCAVRRARWAPPRSRRSGSCPAASRRLAAAGAAWRPVRAGFVLASLAAFVVIRSCRRSRSCPCCAAPPPPAPTRRSRARRSTSRPARRHGCRAVTTLGWRQTRALPTTARPPSLVE